MAQFRAVVLVPKNLYCEAQTIEQAEEILSKEVTKLYDRMGFVRVIAQPATQETEIISPLLHAIEKVRD